MNALRAFIVAVTLTFSTLVGGYEAARSEPPAFDQTAWAGAKKTGTLTNGVHLAYVELADPKGEPLLLLHGYTDTSRSWSLLAPWLAGHRLLIPDQRGHDASSLRECCFTATDFAHDAKLFPDALERPGEIGPVLAAFFESPDR